LINERRLGRTGLSVSEVGYGAWGIGGSMWLGAQDDESVAALHRAIDLGLNFIDTAAVYGNGHSEKLVGQVVRERDERIVVASKIPPKNLQWPAADGTDPDDAFPADHIRKWTERTLTNLGLDVLDVQQFHVWHDNWLERPGWRATRQEMEKLSMEGKVRHWGISINDHAPETALRALADPIFETAQIIYNVFDRSPEKALFALARERDLGIIVRVPFDEGALTGAIRPDTTFPEGDWRHRYFRGDRPAQAAHRADALRELLGEEAKTLPELALRFILSRPEVSTVIPGMRRAEHARANAAVSDGRALSPAMLDRLRAHAWDKNWYLD